MDELIGSLLGPFCTVLGATTLIPTFLCDCSLHFGLNLLQFVEIDLKEEFLFDNFVVKEMELLS